MAYTSDCASVAFGDPFETIQKNEKKRQTEKERWRGKKKAKAERDTRQDMQKRFGPV